MNAFLWFGAALVFAANCTRPQAADTVRDYPGKPIRFVVPFSPGSGSDIVARLIGPKLYESWGQQVVVDNRPSGGGTTAAAIPGGSCTRRPFCARSSP